MQRLVGLTVLIGNLTPSKAVLTFESPTAVAGHATGPIVPRYIQWGLQTGSVLPTTAAVVLDGDLATAYCDQVEAYVVTGAYPQETPKVLQEAKNKAVLVFDEAKLICSHSSFDTFVLHPCQIFGVGAPVISVSNSSSLFGIYAKSFPPDGFEAYVEQNPTLVGCVRLDLVRTPALSHLLTLPDAHNSSATGLTVKIVVDQNPFQRAFDHPLTRVFFQGVCGLLFLNYATLALRVLRMRLLLKLRARLPLLVLLVNTMTLYPLAALLFIDGYGVAGKLHDSVRNALRPNFLGTSVACELLLAQMWTRLVKDTFRGAKAVESRLFASPPVLFAVFALILLDIFSGVYISLRLGVVGIDVVKQLAIAFSVARVIVIVYFSISTRRVLAMLRKSRDKLEPGSLTHASEIQTDSVESSRASSTPSKFHVHDHIPSKQLMMRTSLLRRLAFLLRFSSFAAAILITSLFVVGLSSWYTSSPAAFLFLNAVLILARLSVSVSQIKFCLPTARLRRRIPTSGMLMGTTAFAFNRPGRGVLHNLKQLTRRQINPYEDDF